MFRFAFIVLAGIGLGALLFGGAGGAVAGFGFLALIPIIFLFKVVFIATLFGMFARRRYDGRWGSEDFRPPWAGGRRSQRSASPERDEGPSETERFEEWHRLAHAREEVDGWVTGTE